MENKMMETNNATADFHSYGKIKNNHPWNQQGNNTSSGGAYEDDCANGFSWPPRSYRCSFCKRDFRSAQALGGHMNVHRRDRARLRQSPPPPPPRDVGKCPILNLNLSPNPSPSPSPNFSAPSLFSTRTSPNTWSLPSMVSPSHSSSPLPPGELKKWNGGTIFVDHFSPITSDLGKEKIGKSVLGIKKFDALAGEDECKILKKAEIVRLELGIGFANYSDEVDLELRLGFA